MGKTNAKELKLKKGFSIFTNFEDNHCLGRNYISNERFKFEPFKENQIIEITSANSISRKKRIIFYSESNNKKIFTANIDANWPESYTGELLLMPAENFPDYNFYNAGCRKEDQFKARRKKTLDAHIARLNGEMQEIKNITVKDARKSMEYLGNNIGYIL